MKKILFALMACVAMFGFTACNETVESQIFDLGYDASALESGDAMLYQLTYEQLFIDEISKVAKPVTESGKTFMINSTETKAKAEVKAAFETASIAAQALNDKADIKLKGLKVTLKHSNSKNSGNPADFCEYVFK